MQKRKKKTETKESELKKVNEISKTPDFITLYANVRNTQMKIATINNKSKMADRMHITT